MSQRHGPTPEDRAKNGARINAQLGAAFNNRRTQLEQLRAQRRAAGAAQLQPILNVMLSQRAQMQIVQSPTPAMAASANTEVRSRGLQPLQATVQKLNPRIAGITVTHNGDQLSFAGIYGQPGDGVVINGFAFGSADGEVHFVVGGVS